MKYSNFIDGETQLREGGTASVRILFILFCPSSLVTRFMPLLNDYFGEWKVV